MNPVERLLYIGSRGMGALEFEPAQAVFGSKSFKIELDSLIQVAHFMTKRFDRDGNVKHHVQTLCGIQHFNYNEQLS